MDLHQRVWDFIESRELLGRDDRLVVAVSGGPDSLCLLHVLHRLAAQAFGLRLWVAHLDHGLRPEAAADGAFVRQQAEALGLPCQVGHADTRAHAATHHQSIEEAARVVRYAFLAEAARAAGARHVAVAHTADDQAETVLMHFLRGSGLAGLRGMLPKTEAGSWMSEVGSQRSEVGDAVSDIRPPTSDLYLIRPLLTTTRAEVEAYCHAHGLEPRQDTTNQDTAFLRNRLRHAVLPLLEQVNPNLRAVLARTAEVLAGEHDVVQARLEAVWDEVAPPGLQSEGRVAFERSRWLALSVPEQRGLLRAAVVRLRRHLRDVDFTPLAAAVQFSRAAAPGRSCDVLAGLKLSVGGETVTLHAWGTAAEPSRQHGGPLLAADGHLAAGWRFAVDPLGPEEWSPGQPPPMPHSAWSTYVDAGRLTESPCLRARLPGDRFRPLGLAGHSAKLADFMVNQKIPATLRGQWPVVVCGEQIVWVAGLRLDERYKVRANTQRVVRLCFWEA